MAPDRTDNGYDAIVVGARCAGAPTAMLLAQRGHRVLLVDRATFPSDTLSTHVIHAPGVAALQRWGVLQDVIDSGCPPIEQYSFDFGPVTLTGRPRPAAEGVTTGYAPRRTVLDKILVDAASAAGVEVREGFSVDEVLVEDGVVVGITGHGEGGRTVTERAQVVVGADGRSSRLAKAVRPHAYNEKPELQWSYYSYFSGLPVEGMEIVIRPNRGWAAVPTNDDLTMLVVGWPIAEATAYKADVEENFLATLEMAPDFAARVRAATREDRFHGGSVPNYFRTPFGPGWALVGDAGYNKDPITAQGISDAFRDAEACAAALDSWLTGSSPFDVVMASYQARRDEAVLPLYEFTTGLATMEPPPPEVQQIIGAAHGNQGAMDDFVSLTVGTVSPMTFFAPENVGRIMSEAGAGVAAG